MGKRGEGVDLSELREGLRRGRRRGKMNFDVGEGGLTDGQRAEMLAALVEEFSAEGLTEQDCVQIVGLSAHPKGRSFDESLKAIYDEFVVSRMRAKTSIAFAEAKRKLLREYLHGSHKG